MKTSNTLKASVTTRGGKFHWSLEDANGTRMAFGEEYQLRHAFQAAYDTVSAVRAWIMYGRGDLLCRDQYLHCEFEPQKRTGN